LSGCVRCRVCGYFIHLHPIDEKCQKIIEGTCTECYFNGPPERLVGSKAHQFYVRRAGEKAYPLIKGKI
jgi:hypothetical protein